MDDAHEGQGVLSTLVPVTQDSSTARDIRTGNGRTRPDVRDRSQMDPQIRPNAVEIIFQMLHDRSGVGGGRRHQKLCLAKAPGRAVVEGNAILAQHQSIASLADRQGRKHVGVDPVKEFRCIRDLGYRSCQAWKHRQCRHSAELPAPRGYRPVRLFRHGWHKSSGDAKGRLHRFSRRLPDANHAWASVDADANLRIVRQPRTPRETGVNGGRNRVVPASGIEIPRTSAMMARPGTLEVLP